MKKLKVMTVVGTRPEIIRLSSVIKALDSSKIIEHIFVHTGQNYDYELNEIFFSDFDIRRPDYFLSAATKNPMETIGNILQRIEPILDKEIPDAFLVLGDTNSCLSVIAAKRRKIPIFHMEAGNRCYDQRVPEETNRKIVDHISDINLPYSSIAREYLINEGFPIDRIIKTGSPMLEVVMSKIDQINESKILKRLDLEKGRYFLVSAHREENINSQNFLELVNTLNLIAQKYTLPIIVSTHPRTKKMIDDKHIVFNSLVNIIKPLGYIDYNRLQLDSLIVLSDSGTISEESSILGFRALNLRETHERPEAMEEGTVIMTGVKADRVIQSIEYLLENSEAKPIIVKDYNVNNVSSKVLKIIISYIDYVNLKVWNSGE